MLEARWRGVWGVPWALVALTASGLPACEGCEDVSFSAMGTLEPASYNFGLVPQGQSCSTELALKNSGQSDLTVNKSGFVDSTGDFKVDGIVPAFVQAYGSERIVVTYTAGAPGAAEGATLRLETNTSENDGRLEAVLRGTPVDGQVSMIMTSCGADDEVSPCDELDFGSTIVAEDNFGVVRKLRLTNDGTRELLVLQPTVLDNPDYLFDAAYVPPADGVGAPVEVTAWPVTLQPARGECNAPSDNVVTFVDIAVRYVPSQAGVDLGRLHVDTDADIEPSSLDVTLLGVGSGEGLLIQPATLQFGEVGEGQSKTLELRVANMRDQDARINLSCVDQGRDGTCDVECTAIDDAAVMSCGVERSDGSHEGKGFLLGPADAQEGGDDERIVKVRWAPDRAGQLRAQLLLKTAIEGDKTYEVLITGGVAGVLTPSVDRVEVPATGDPLSGSVDFTVTNTGQATLTIVQVYFIEASQNSTAIRDQFTLTRAGDQAFSVSGQGVWLQPFTLDIDASDTFTLSYEDQSTAVVNCEQMDIHFLHDGEGQSPYILSVEVDGTCD